MADATDRRWSRQAFAHAPQRAKAFAAAARHSARVRFLRVALLGGAVGAVALLVGIAVFDPFGRLAGGVSIGGIGLDGTKVTMDHPKLSGFRKDGRPYRSMRTRRCRTRCIRRLVELYGIDADVALADNGVGAYDGEIRPLRQHKRAYGRFRQTFVSRARNMTCG